MQQTCESLKGCREESACKDADQSMHAQEGLLDSVWLLGRLPHSFFNNHASSVNSKSPFLKAPGFLCKALLQGPQNSSQEVASVLCSFASPLHSQSCFKQLVLSCFHIDFAPLLAQLLEVLQALVSNLSAGQWLQTLHSFWSFC